MDVMNPERTRLRALLDTVLRDEHEGKPIDLQPVRRLVAALVQTSGRHTWHGTGRPVLGKHACTRGKAGCPVCRYGFPHKKLNRDGKRKMRRVKGESEGSWFARFPRNDALCCSYEAHVLLDN